MKIIELQKRIGTFYLNVNDLIIEDKKINGVIGCNGSGKSTFVKLIAGLLKPDNGKIDYGAIDMQDITITAQRPYMLHDSVLNNLIYPLKIRKIKVSKEEIAEWLNKCGLSGKEEQFAPSLSSGERQKLSFARALIFKPKVVIVDETMANLDPDSVAIFEQIILDIQKTEPITWIIVSHQPGHIFKLCDRVHFMENGGVLCSGSPDEIFLNKDNPTITKYMSNYMIKN